jgi:hypothetical protein
VIEIKIQKKKRISAFFPTYFSTHLFIEVNTHYFFLPHQRILIFFDNFFCFSLITLLVLSLSLLFLRTTIIMILQHAARSVGKGLTRGAVSRVVAPISFPSPSSSSSPSPSPSLHHFPAPYRTSSLQFYSSSSPSPSFTSRPLSTLSASSASPVLPTFLRRSLKEPLPQFIEDPSSSSSSSLSKAPETRVTTLPNGVRLASREHYGVTATLGAHLALGTCDEEPHQYGIAHLLERMTFKVVTFLFLFSFSFFFFSFSFSFLFSSLTDFL